MGSKVAPSILRTWTQPSPSLAPSLELEIVANQVQEQPPGASPSAPGPIRELLFSGNLKRLPSLVAPSLPGEMVPLHVGSISNALTCFSYQVDK